MNEFMVNLRMNENWIEQYLVEHVIDAHRKVRHSAIVDFAGPPIA